MKLYAIVDASVNARLSHLELLEMVLAGGADVIQLRDKKMKTGELFSLAAAMSIKCKQAGIPFIVNDRVDIAFLCGADGVHLGKEDFPVAAARKILGNKIIGATAHSVEEALAAEKEGADYIGFGHIFPTASKIKSTPPVGTVALAEVCARVRIPVFAIGGIDEKNIDGVLKANPAGAAVIGAITASPDPAQASRRLKELMSSASPA